MERRGAWVIAACALLAGMHGCSSNSHDGEMGSGAATAGGEADAGGDAGASGGAGAGGTASGHTGGAGTAGAGASGSASGGAGTGASSGGMNGGAGASAGSGAGRGAGAGGASEPADDGGTADIDCDPTCPDGQRCELVQVQCVRAPCPPLPMCTPIEGAGKSCGSRGQAPCAEGEFCDFPIGAMCGAADAPGQCRAQPRACTREYVPVCGCDDHTYGNACEAASAGVSVLHEGAC